MKYWFLLALFIAQMSDGLADMGPKPTMSFNFPELKSKGLTIERAVLYEGKKADGSDATPLKSIGPQRFQYGPQGCFAMAYGFAPYQRLKVTLSDGKTHWSKVFSGTGMRSYFVVTVGTKGLTVKSTDKQFNWRDE